MQRLHLLVTDGGFRPDGTFVSWPVPDTARSTEAFRRTVLRLFVRSALFDEDQDVGMLTWPHSGFPGVYASGSPASGLSCEYCSRNPGVASRIAALSSEDLPFHSPRHEMGLPSVQSGTTVAPNMYCSIASGLTSAFQILVCDAAIVWRTRRSDPYALLPPRLCGTTPFERYRP